MSESSKWTLEGELQKVAEVDGLAAALHKLGLINRIESTFLLLGGDGEWVRGGAETYVFRFQVDEVGERPKDVIIKACAAYSPGAGLSDILHQWIQRRRLLQANGVQTPHLYGYGYGVIIEEYIEHSLCEVIKMASPNRNELVRELAIYAAVLSKLGFAPIGPFQDLRSRGSDVVAIDFGEDLGPAHINGQTQSQIFSKLSAYLQELGLVLSDKEINELRTIFAAY
jgi:hypothetical protein